MDREVRDPVLLGRFAVEDREFGPVALGERGKPGRGIDHKRRAENDKKVAAASPRARAISSSGIACPNEMVAVFTMPPQAGQSGGSPCASKCARIGSSSIRAPQSRHLA
jgi:hypothetical protein